MIVIADTTPLNYLVLIGRVEILPELYGRVLIPPAVWEEFQRPETPEAVRAWISRRPAWLEIHGIERSPEPALAPASTRRSAATPSGPPELRIT
jgi:predicted nucleic acid-binding protein